jgi:hypothetical protein
MPATELRAISPVALGVVGETLRATAAAAEAAELARRGRA